MGKKYRLTDETRLWRGHTLYRIEALKDFGNVKQGELGGWIESENNLSHDDDCWVGGEAVVCDNAYVSNNAQVSGDSCVYDDAVVSDNARVSGKSKVYGKVKVCGDAVIKCDSDYIVFKNSWSSGRYFTWTRSNNKWSVGCFYGTGKELVEKAYADSEKSGIEYQRVVNYVQGILGLPNIEGEGKATKQFSIKTMNDVVAFFSHVMFGLGIDINPEDSFKDVTDKDGKKTMSDEEAERYDKTLEDCFKVCEENGRDLYQIFFRMLGLYSYANDNELLRILCDRNVKC